MKIKWGVIGCGGIADRRTIPGMLEASNAELIAVMDTNRALAEDVKNRRGAKYAFDKLEDILAVDEIDAVYIATPVFCHAEQVKAAAAAKKHILLEKPMALTSAEAAQLGEICDAAGVRLSIGFMMRFHAYHEEIKRIIAAGKIGDVVSMRAQFSCWYPDIPGAWRQKKEISGGGALMDMGIHSIDLLQYLTGLQVSEVTSFQGTQTFSYDVDDGATVLMKMSNGAIASVDSNFNIPDDAVCAKLEIYGTAGSIRADGTLAQEEVGTVWVLTSDTGRGYDASQKRGELTPSTIDVPTGNMYTKEIERFGEAIQNGTPVPVSAAEAVTNQRIAEAAYQSCAEKRFIKMD